MHMCNLQGFWPFPTRLSTYILIHLPLPMWLSRHSIADGLGDSSSGGSWVLNMPRPASTPLLQGLLTSVLPRQCWLILSSLLWVYVAPQSHALTCWPSIFIPRGRGWILNHFCSAIARFSLSSSPQIRPSAYVILRELRESEHPHTKTSVLRYAASTAAPYPLGFIHLDLDG